jgi:16S rRNA (guanine966-N2)-methyltransferase
MRITGGRFKNHQLRAPKGTQTRPSSEKLRQTVFNICQASIEKSHFLDVFAGSGAMGIEALSRGASHATFIEKSSRALLTIKDNLTKLDLMSSATLLREDALIGLKKLIKNHAEFDLIFIDPPYGLKVKETQDTYLDILLTLIDQSSLLSSDGTLFFEETSSPKAPLQSLLLEKKRKLGNTHLYQYVK